MKLRPVLGAIVSVFAVMFSMLALACTSASPVPIQATPAEISALAGHWEGEYSSKATGRLGSIVLDLIAGEDHAHGDVLMIPRDSNQPYRPARGSGGQSPGPGEATQLLKIRFIRAEGGRLSGTLDSYWDPDCSCEVTTTFVGEVRGDTVEGTFTSERTAGRVFGTWSARRKAAAIR